MGLVFWIITIIDKKAEERRKANEKENLQFMAKALQEIGKMIKDEIKELMKEK